MKKVMFLSILFFSFFVSAEDVTCENEAGDCKLSGNEYVCNCQRLAGVGKVSGNLTGEEADEELCESYLENNCGKEKPTVINQCGDKLDYCITYYAETSQCNKNQTEYMTEDEIRIEVESDEWNRTKEKVYNGCCLFFERAQINYECLKENCVDFADECCAECALEANDGADTADTVDTDDGGDIVDTADTADTVDTADTDITDTADTGDNGDTEVISPAPEDDSADSTDTDDVDTANTDADDTANTETPKDGSAPAEDTTDGDKKEESKSDGCLMLFI